MEFKDVLKFLRKENNLSQADLSQRIGVSLSSISMYEIGKRTPELETFEKLADFFNVDMDYLKGKSDVKRKASFMLGSELAKMIQNVSDSMGVPYQDLYGIFINKKNTERTPLNEESLRKFFLEKLSNDYNITVERPVVDELSTNETPEGLSEDEEQLIAAFRKLDPILRKYILFSVVNASRFLDITLELDRIENEYRASYTQQRPDDIANAR